MVFAEAAPDSRMVVFISWTNLKGWECSNLLHQIAFCEYLHLFREFECCQTRSEGNYLIELLLAMRMRWSLLSCLRTWTSYFDKIICEKCDALWKKKNYFLLNWAALAYLNLCRFSLIRVSTCIFVKLYRNAVFELLLFIYRLKTWIIFLSTLSV